MGETSEKKKGISGLLEKIPAEKCWAITSKALTGLICIRGSKTIAPLLSKGKGIFAPAMGWEKYEEINARAYAEAGKRSFPWLKETFKIPVEDAVGAAKLRIVAATLLGGPEYKFEIAEATWERVVLRWTQCPWWERYKENEVDPGLTVCDSGHQAFTKEGFKVINSKLTYTLTKALPWGDPYCEEVIEFKEE